MKWHPVGGTLVLPTDNPKTDPMYVNAGEHLEDKEI